MRCRWAAGGTCWARSTSVPRTVLAGGVALYATNEFLTISLLPSAVAEIGGQRLYAWVTTVYLVASVVAATTVSATLARFGPRWSYLAALGVFGVGSVLATFAPTMELLLVGRTVQGAGGGVLAGLGYAVINSALPQSLWTKASALVSAMWGVGTLRRSRRGRTVRPIRFVALGIRCTRGPDRGDGGLGAVRAAGTPARMTSCRRRSRIPVWSLLLLGSAALAVSVAGILRNLGFTVARWSPASSWSESFLVVDRRTTASVLPPTAFRPGPLKWIYLTLGLLMAATMVDMYVPLFGQRLAHLVPVAAGFLGVALAVGWTVGEIVSASVTKPRVIVRMVAVAPLVMAVGLGLAAVSQVEDAPIGVIAVWVLALVITGIGVGHGLAAPFGVGDGLRRRPQRGRHRSGGDQHRAADLRRIRRRVGGHRREPDRSG